MLVPVIKALKTLGGSGRINEIDEQVTRDLKLPEEIIDYPHGGDNSRFELNYQLAWARTVLKHLNLITNTDRGVWVTTEKGQVKKNLTNIKLVKDHNKWARERRKLKKKQKIKTVLEGDKIKFTEDEEIEAETDEKWKIELRAILKALNPFGFENLVKRVLRESGFTEVEVTRKTGDGGFDGRGILRLNNLISETIIFECKRYKDTVGPEKIRNFRGAMEGRAKKGLFITTSTYTQSAKEEAIREGAAPIDLIDGEELIEILKNLELGVKKVETFEVDRNWFKSYQ